MSPITRAVAVASPPVALVLVVLATWSTPGYDPVSRTVSRLAMPGMPAGAIVDVAIVLVAFTCVALARGLTRGAVAGRVALVVAGVAFLATAVIHLDDGSSAATALHRAASGV